MKPSCTDDELYFKTTTLYMNTIIIQYYINLNLNTVVVVYLPVTSTVGHTIMMFRTSKLALLRNTFIFILLYFPTFVFGRSITIAS